MSKKKMAFYIASLAMILAASILCSLFLDSCSQALARRIYPDVYQEEQIEEEGQEPETEGENEDAFKGERS